MSDTTIWNQLMILKSLTFEAGTLHDAQIFQLKVWAKLMFDEAEETTINVAVQTRWVVEFAVKASADWKMPREDLLRGLSNSVKDLLGDYFTVKVLLNGTAIFEDKGKPKKKRNLRATMKRLKDADKGATKD